MFIGALYQVSIYRRFTQIHAVNICVPLLSRIVDGCHAAFGEIYV